MSKELTRDDLLHLYSLATLEVQALREVNQDEYAHNKQLEYYDNLADKLRILYEGKEE